MTSLLRQQRAEEATLRSHREQMRLLNGYMKISKAHHIARRLQLTPQPTRSHDEFGLPPQE